LHYLKPPGFPVITGVALEDKKKADKAKACNVNGVGKFTDNGGEVNDGLLLARLKLFRHY
jgi:hypothetical protein